MTHKDLNWYHTITLLNGEKTAGRIDTDTVADHYLLPSDLRGKSAVDFATYDGYWAIECQKRGASSVIASDGYSIPTAVFALGERNIKYVAGNDYNLDASFTEEAVLSIGEHDIVLFYGVLYHLKNPVLGLVNAARCCKRGGSVFVESATNQGHVKNLPKDIPLTWLINGPYEENMAGDLTNFTMPNPAAVKQMCIMAGLVPTGSEYLTPNGGRYTLVCTKP
jgi:tRNA (mo5U34)-methyltransferase